jgi:hypothetical protein
MMTLGDRIRQSCRRALAFALVLLSITATPASVFAARARASVIAGRLRYVEVGNFVNLVTMTVDINGDLIIHDQIVIKAGFGCTTVLQNDVNCGPATAITSMLVSLGADPDHLDAGSLSIPMVVKGGGGGDFITSGSGDDLLVGGRGDDITSSSS